MKLVNNIIQLFPVDIFIQENLPIDRDVMEEEILKIEKNKSGRTKSNMGGFQSPPVEGEDRWKEFYTFMDFVKTSFKNIGRHYGYKDETKISISAPWININYYKDSNAAHVHGEADWSYVYFVKVPKHSGHLILMDPRLRRTAKNLKEEVLTKGEMHSSQKSHQGINSGDNSLVIFPAYVEHAVPPNQTHEARITMAGNIFLNA